MSLGGDHSPLENCFGGVALKHGQIPGPTLVLPALCLHTLMSLWFLYFLLRPARRLGQRNYHTEAGYRRHVQECFPKTLKPQTLDAQGQFQTGSETVDARIAG